MKELNFKVDIVLENSRVRLEPLTQEHHPFLLPIALNQPDLLKFSPSQFGTSKFLKDYIEHALEQRKAERRYAFSIFDKEKDHFAGSTSLGEICHKNRRLQIGWTWLGKDFQRTGLNRNCKFLLLKHSFEDLEFERVEFVTDSRNVQSQKAIEAIGGKLEGELRSHTVMPDGFRRNSRYYSILLQEWEQIKNKVFPNFLET